MHRIAGLLVLSLRLRLCVLARSSTIPLTRSTKPIALFRGRTPEGVQVQTSRAQGSTYAKASYGDLAFNNWPQSLTQVSNWESLLFLANITVGTPPQPFRAILDTGWSDLFVPSSKCADSYCDLHQLYDASLSSSYAPDGSPVQVHYGGLYTEGNVSQDTVRVADLQVLGQSFEEASLLRPVPLYFDNIFDTVLGLARIPPNVSRDSTLEARSLLQNIVDQGLLKRNNFALDLPRKDGEVGQLTLGVTADDKDGLVEFPVREISASDHALPDDLNAGWQVEASSVSLGDPSDPKSVHGPLINCTAVLASGYPFIDLPSDLHRSIKTRVNSDPDQYGTLDCNRRSSLPNLTVSLGPSNSSHGFTLTPWDYLLEVHFEDVGTRCLSTFTAHAESEGNYIVLGSAFLTGVYSIFDLDAKTISLGPSKRARVDTFDGSPSEQSLS